MMKLNRDCAVIDYPYFMRLNIDLSAVYMVFFLKFL